VTKVVHTLKIGNIVLFGLDVTSERAERLRVLVESELARLFSEGEFPDGIASTRMSRLKAPTMHLTESQSDIHLARSLARSIVLALHGVR